MKRGTWVVALSVAVACSLVQPRAQADTAVEALSETGGAVRPWARGVSEQNQRRANELVQEGNALIKESFFAQAVAKYREALEHWDHPGVHYNLALALLTLDEPVATHRHLSEAMKYGAAPIGQDKHDYAEKYLALLNQQVVHIQVRCQEPGAEVRLDGQLLFRAPGEFSGLVRRGEHSLTASKAGYETTQVSRMMEAGEPVVLELRLFRPEELLVEERRYPLWIPITVSATGLALVGAGAFASYSSQRSYDRFDRAISDDPGCSFGCVPDDDVARHLERGNLLRTLSVVGYAAGGATLAAGIALWVFDKKDTRRVTPEELQDLAVLPLLGPGTVGVAGTARF